MTGKYERGSHDDAARAALKASRSEREEHIREWTVSLDYGDIVKLRLHDAWDVAILKVDLRVDDAGGVPVHAGQLRSLAFALGEAAALLEARGVQDKRQETG